eukprot:GHVO01045764.1.p1 GENE.GHVO01045764.1~~GHVO01045764.1.p1  ORF type:complete len:251 (+),score=35.38 GHVO01045764.1:27-779(+)
MIGLKSQQMNKLLQEHDTISFQGVEIPRLLFPCDSRCLRLLKSYLYLGTMDLGQESRRNCAALIIQLLYIGYCMGMQELQDFVLSMYHGLLNIEFVESIYNEIERYVTEFDSHDVSEFFRGKMSNFLEHRVFMYLEITCRHCIIQYLYDVSNDTVNKISFLVRCKQEQEVPHSPFSQLISNRRGWFREALLNRYEYNGSMRSRIRQVLQTVSQRNTIQIIDDLYNSMLELRRSQHSNDKAKCIQIEGGHV